MFAFSDSFLAGYMAGESATDRQKAIDSVWQGIDGRRQIQVDQSYLDSHSFPGILLVLGLLLNLLNLWFPFLRGNLLVPELLLNL